VSSPRLSLSLPPTATLSKRCAPWAAWGCTGSLGASRRRVPLNLDGVFSVKVGSAPAPIRISAQLGPLRHSRRAGLSEWR